MSDDEIIGLKSTSIKFKKNIKLFLSIVYFLMTLILCYLFKDNIGKNISSLLLSLCFISIFYQVILFDHKDSKSCLKIFKMNNFTGLILFLSILSINL